MTEIKISVRSLVEFLLREGDIDNRLPRVSEQVMLEGGRIHRKIQKMMGPHYEAEVPLSYRENCGDYYLSVEENFLVNGSKEQADRFENPKTRLMAAIRRVYPKPEANGNDAAVIAACDQEYAEYVDMYSGMSENFTCVFHLVRATMKGGIIKQNETLKTYIYDINPTED